VLACENKKIATGGDMQLDDITISKAITESFMKDFIEAMQVDVAIGGAGPAPPIATSTSIASKKSFIKLSVIALDIVNSSSIFPPFVTLLFYCTTS